jgi:hypothetical protein
VAKRFTDTGKWGKASFTELSNEWKLVWIYLCDNCDHAGIWDVNFRLMAFHLGQPFSRAALEEAFGDKVRFLSDTKLFLPSFVEFQYGTLNPDNRAHFSVINRLEKEGANKGLTRSSQGRKDKEKDKDTDKDSLEGVKGKPFRPDLDAVYARYPRKEGKSLGLKKLAASIKTPSDFDDAFKALAAFLAHHKRKGTQAEFIPQFKTWAGSWRDCLDPSYGQSESFSSQAIDEIELKDYGT